MESLIPVNGTVNYVVKNNGIIVSLACDLTWMCVAFVFAVMCCRECSPVFSQRNSGIAGEELQESSTENDKPLGIKNRSLRWLFKLGEEYEKFSISHGKLAGSFLYLQRIFTYVFLVFTIFTLFALFPVYVSGQKPVTELISNSTFSWSGTQVYEYSQDDNWLLFLTISMVQDDMFKLVVSVIMTYVFVITVFVFLYCFNSSRFICDQLGSEKKISNYAVDISGIQKEFDMNKMNETFLTDLANKQIFDDTLFAFRSGTNALKRINLEEELKSVNDNLRHFKKMEENETKFHVKYFWEYVDYTLSRIFLAIFCCQRKKSNKTHPDVFIFKQKDAVIHYEKKKEKIENRIVNWEKKFRKKPQGTGKGHIIFKTIGACETAKRYLKNRYHIEIPIQTKSQPKKPAETSVASILVDSRDNSSNETCELVEIKEENDNEKTSKKTNDLLKPFGAVLNHLTKRQSKLPNQFPFYLSHSSPSPTDIIWENYLSREVIPKFRSVSIHLVMILYVLIFTTPFTLVNTFLSLFFQIYQVYNENLSIFLESNYFRFLSDFALQILPTYFLMVASTMIKYIIPYLTRFEKYKFRSKNIINNTYRIFIYNVLTTTILPTFLLTSFDGLLIYFENPENFVQILNQMFLPSSGAFFVNYLIHYSTSSIALEVLRIPNMIKYAFFQSFAITKKEKRAAHKRATKFFFGIEFAESLSFMVIVLSYSVFCPLVNIIGLIYFFFKYVIYRYNFNHLYQDLKEYEMDKVSFQRFLETINMMCTYSILIFEGFMSLYFLKLSISDKKYFPFFFAIFILLLLSILLSLVYFANELKPNEKYKNGSSKLEDNFDVKELESAYKPPFKFLYSRPLDDNVYEQEKLFFEKMQSSNSHEFEDESEFSEYDESDYE